MIHPHPHHNTAPVESSSNPLERDGLEGFNTILAKSESPQISSNNAPCTRKKPLTWRNNGPASGKKALIRRNNGLAWRKNEPGRRKNEPFRRKKPPAQSNNAPGWRKKCVTSGNKGPVWGKKGVVKKINRAGLTIPLLYQQFFVKILRTEKAVLGCYSFTKNNFKYFSKT